MRAMTLVAFSKVHGLGNDFVLCDLRADAEIERSRDWNTAARRLCDRHTSIGADGVLLLLEARDRARADARMRIFNADGTEAEMCGNGIRCIARRLTEESRASGAAGAHQAWRLETMRGVVEIEVQVDARGEFLGATVDMGTPVLEAERIAVLAHGQDPRRLAIPAWLNDAAYSRDAGIEERMSCISMGNPHAVVWCREPRRIPLAVAGPRLETDAMFPAKTNVHFVTVRSAGAAAMITWERGVGPTMACGSGACAVLVAGALTGRLARTAAISVPGGTLDIAWRDDDHVMMTGPAAVVFAGTIEL